MVKMTSTLAVDDQSPWGFCPKHLHLGTEMCGNEILVDLGGGDDGPVVGLWHDPSYLIVIAKSLSDWRTMKPGWSTGDEFDLDDHLQLNEVAASDRGDATLLASGIMHWVSQLPDGARIFDLRNSRPGAYFDWGKAERFFRHPTEFVFAMEPKPPGLFSRMFGRK
jgi:hypothetical protein